MSHAADTAIELADAHVAAALARVDRTMPVGQPGECDECGELMPRLVGGRCGFCRDGRRPPAEQYPAAPAAPVPTKPEETVMPTPKVTDDAQTISVPAKGAVLAAIRQRAAAEDLPLGRAASAIIADALAAPVQRADVVLIDLTQVSTDDLMDELSARLSTLGAALARAEAAEGQLATVRQVLAIARPEGERAAG